VSGDAAGRPGGRAAAGIGARAAAGLLALAAWAGGAAQAAPATTTLTLAEREVRIDVYRPAGAPRGAVILSHGFTRSRATLGGHAAALADEGALALAPDLPCTFDFHCNARALADLVSRLRAGGPFGAPVRRVVLVGFSAGGLSSLLAASTPGVVGYVGLDPFDRIASDGRALGLESARGLRTDAVLLRAPPSRCNAHAVAAPWGAALPRLREDRVIDGASHCDFESPTDWMCRLACGDTDPGRQAAVRQRVVEAVRGWLAGPADAMPR
jgi:dienelactone hydrolase